MSVPTAWRTRRIDFGAGPCLATTIQWGELSTAFHRTGIGDVEVYVAVPSSTRRLMIASRYGDPLLRTPLVRGILLRAARRRPRGPDADERAVGVEPPVG